jgi:hypothetical protein
MREQPAYLMTVTPQWPQIRNPQPMLLLCAYHLINFSSYHGLFGSNGAQKSRSEFNMNRETAQ